MREQTVQASVRPSGRRGGRRRAVPAAAAAAAVAVAVTALGGVAPSDASAAARPDGVRQGLNALVHSDGVPAALASVQDRAGRNRSYTAGVGDLATGAGVPEDGQVRIGSNTKAFTAVVVLQLVGEGRIRLDKPVDFYLPDLLRGNGIDGGRITVRNLLQHTSGLPNYTKYLDEEIRRYEPRELLDIALRHEPEFDPGDGWAYSNTNYVVAGLLIEKITGHSIAEEIDRRVIKRIGLRHTYFPAPGDVTIREPHPKGYYQDAPGAPLRDGTELDPSWGWAAGQMISTDSDLNRFYSELLAGHLLDEDELDEMQTTVPAGYPFPEGARYGLGLVSTPLSCGDVYWGHGGSTTGYETRGGARQHGRAMNIAVTTQPGQPTKQRMDTILDRELCR
ncbi:serine hydrolase domain-containing protein [Streptomyces sp. NPDC052114]|uniref:serine hydrolase domain-containing protein n=1 Tax=unclassified Streptomyces TaxID=2593676 RepID=UPI00341A51FB